MAAWRSGVSDLRVTAAPLGTFGAIVRRYAATLIGVGAWVVIACAVVAFWLGFIFGLAWLFG